MNRYAEYQALKNQGLKDTEIAAICGVSRQAVAKCIKIHTDPDFREKIVNKKNEQQKRKYKIDPVYREKRRRAANKCNQRKQENV